MADVAPVAVQPDDPRSAAVGSLWKESERSFVGQATVIGPGCVVTVAELSRAGATVVQVMRPGVPVYRLTAPAEIDPMLDFGILKVPEAESQPSLASTAVAMSGDVCELLWYDPSRNQVFELSGRVGGMSTVSFQFALYGSPGLPVGGAPVFIAGRVIGIVGGRGLDDFDPKGYESAAFRAGYLHVLTLGGITQSKAGRAVRGLLTRLEGTRGAAGSVESAAQHGAATPGTGNARGFPPPIDSSLDGSPGWQKFGAQSSSDTVRQEISLETESATKEASTVTHEAPSSTAEYGKGNERAVRPTERVPDANLNDAELWARLAPSARVALARATGFQRAAGSNQVGVGYLLAGLFPNWQRFLMEEGISQTDLEETIRQEYGVRLPWKARPADLAALPPLSENSRVALAEAAKDADARGSKGIWSSHLLYGVLSATNSAIVQRLVQLGVHREEVHGKGDDGEEQASASSVTDRAPSVAVGFDGAAFVAKLGDSGRSLLARAEGFRVAARQDRMHMEHLVAGLFAEWRQPFTNAGIDEQELNRIFRDAVGTTIDLDAKPVELKVLPPLSKHVQQALEGAMAEADQLKRGIWRAELMDQMFRVTDCKVIRPLRERRVFAPEIPGEERKTPEASAPDKDAQSQDKDKLPVAPAAPQAAPTPKVDSDLWCSGELGMGYEAYARTIAALITHKDTKAPLTIGIKAPWGAGKTSLMKRVQHLLDGRAELSEENRSGARQMGQAARMTLWTLRHELKKITKADKATLKAEEMPQLPTPSNTEGEQRYKLPARITVWFNAWKYQTSEQIWAGLAHCIISQVTARMTPLERELFWLRLHARRINTEEVRRKIHGLLLRMFVPAALMIVVTCALVIWAAAALQLSLPWLWTINGLTAVSGLIGIIWKARETLGEKAAGSMKQLVREPDYEGKMGYLHLVESDIREVLDLVTQSSRESQVASTESNSTQRRPLPADKSKAPLLATPARNGAPEAREKKVPLVVFVDDLDRCAPNKVAEVVEAINLFLCGDYPNCIFVLGMEPGMVAAALEVANKDVIEKALEMGVMDRTAPVGWRFMEKIVQMPVMIPPPTKPGRDLYVESLVGRMAEGSNLAVAQVATSAPHVEAPAPPKEEHVEKFVAQMKSATLEELRAKSDNILAKVTDEEREAAKEASLRAYGETFSERDPAIAKFVNDVAELVDANPRQVKRYVNVFRFYSTLRFTLEQPRGPVPKDKLPSDEMLAKFVAMSIQWPHAMDCLRAKNCLDANGNVVSRLEFLEWKAGETKDDEAWKKIVGDKGMNLGPWAHAAAFRMFLAQGKPLGNSGGHGLW